MLLTDSYRVPTETAAVLHRRHWLAASAALCLPALGLPVAAAERLVITGSSTLAPLVLEMAKRFEKRHAGVRIDVQTGGSARGIADARTGSAQLGLVSRALKADEGDLQAHTVAMDGVCLIVHRSNPVAGLSDAQVRAIYTGQVTQWSAIAGAGAAGTGVAGTGAAGHRISVVNKAEGRSTLDLFLAYFQLKNSDIRAAVVIGDNAQGIKTVAANPGAIGYVSIGTAAFEASQGTPIRLLPRAGVAATVEQVRQGRFALSRPLNLVTRGEPSPLARSFIQFARSKAVHDLVEAQFFVTLPPG